MKHATTRLPHRATAAACLLALAMLAGCDTPPERRQETTGNVIGTVVGGVIGHQIGGGSGRDVATVAGAIAGMLVGGAVGRSMDQRDRQQVTYALESAPTNAPSRWVNPDTGRSYTVVPSRTYSSPNGPCREYTVDAVIGGRSEKVYGTACRQADGSWHSIQ